MRSCPVCDADPSASVLFLEENIDAARLSRFSFSSRKEPEFMNARLVRCLNCDLVYVEAPPSQEALTSAYREAAYDSSGEAEDAARSYIEAFRPILAKLPRKGGALEIGTGTGALLDLLAAEGFSTLHGVEPSAAAIAAAPEARRRWIRQGAFNEAAYQPQSLDLICCPMTLEHVRDPRSLAKSARRLLRPGGAFVTVAHDYRGMVNRILGKRSPIVDIEHMQLFSRRSMRRLLESTGYRDITVRPLANSYSLTYWLRLMPLPAHIKATGRRIISGLRVDHLKARLNVGNIIAAGYR